MGGATSGLGQLHESLVQLFNLSLADKQAANNLLDTLFSSNVTYDEFMWVVSHDLVREIWSFHPQHSEMILKRAVRNIQVLVENKQEVFLRDYNFGRMDVFIINSIRVLARFLPCLMQLASCKDDVNDDVFISYASKFCFNMLFSGNNPLLSRIMNMISRLMLHPGFCIHEASSLIQKNAAPELAQPFMTLGLYEDALWINVLPSLPYKYDSGFYYNRLETLRALLMSLTAPLYRDANVLNNSIGFESVYFLLCLPIPFLKTLYYSLLSMIVSYHPYSIPFAHNVVRNNDLVEILHILLLLLDAPLDITFSTCQSVEMPVQPVTTSVVKLKQVSKDSLSSLPLNTRKNSSALLMEPIVSVSPEFSSETITLRNVFHEFTSAISVIDCEDILTALSRLLTIEIHRSNSTVRFSQESFIFIEEVSFLFWHLITKSETFYEYVCSSQLDVFIVPMVYHMLNWRKNVDKKSLVHLYSFIFLKLSSSRSFSVNLSHKPVVASKNLLNYIGLDEWDTIADLLILAIHKTFIANHNMDPSAADSLGHMMFTVIANISPYLTNLGLVASVKLVNLLDVILMPNFLMCSADNYKFLVYLLEVFNNVIQYQFSTNCNLVYAMLKRENIFRKIETLQIDPVGSLTTEWFNSWKSTLPITSILRLLDHLCPIIKQRQSLSSSFDVTGFLSSYTMVGILPLPHSLVVRKYAASPQTNHWLHSTLYATVFMRWSNNVEAKLLETRGIKLFGVRERILKHADEEEDI